MVDFNAAWDAWEAAGHADCGGWLHDPGPAVIRCACGTAIPFPAGPGLAVSDTAGPGPDEDGYEHRREQLLEDGADELAGVAAAGGAP